MFCFENNLMVEAVCCMKVVTAYKTSAMTKIYSFSFENNLIWTLRNIVNFAASKQFGKSAAEISLELFNDMDFHECKSNALIIVREKSSQDILFYAKHEAEGYSQEAKKLQVEMNTLSKLSFDHAKFMLPFMIFLGESGAVSCTDPAPGTSVYQLMMDEDVEQLLKACKCLGTGLAEIHRTPISLENTIESVIGKQLKLVKDIRSSLDETRDFEQRKICKYLSDNKEAFLYKDIDKDIGLTHYDPTPSNVFYDKDDLTVVLLESPYVQISYKAVDTVWFMEHFKIYSYLLGLPAKLVSECQESFIRAYKHEAGNQMYSEESYLYQKCRFWLHRKYMYGSAVKNMSSFGQQYHKTLSSLNDLVSNEFLKVSKELMEH